LSHTYDRVSMMRLRGEREKKFYLLALPTADGMQMTRAKPKYSKKLVLVPMQR